VSWINQDVRAYSYDSTNAWNKSDFEVIRAWGTQASPTRIWAWHSIWGYRFRAHDGNAFQSYATITTRVEDTISTTNGAPVPVRMAFVVDDTNTYSTDTPERMVINSNGNVGIWDINPDTWLRLDVEWPIWATEYCDENGNNCRNILDLSPFWDSDFGIQMDEVILEMNEIMQM